MEPYDDHQYENDEGLQDSEYFQSSGGYYYDAGTESAQDSSGWYEVSCVEAGIGDGRGDPIRTLSFDPVKELIWIGTGCGMLHAHYAPDMSRVVSSYIAEPSSDRLISEDVRDLVLSETSIIAAMGYGVTVITRGGVRRGTVRADTIRDAKGVALNPVSDNHVCVGGESRMLAVLDLEQQRILRQATLRGATSVTGALWTAPGTSGLCIFSTATGRISFCDPGTMREVNAVAAFTGATTAISSSGFFLAATGLGTRGGVPYLEQHVKIFDIRRLDTPLPSVSFPTAPMFVCFDSYTSAQYNTNGAMWILSPDGLLQCLDISSIATGAPAYPLTNPIQLDAGADVLTGIAVSSQGLLALGDAGGFVHQWTSAEAIKVNEDSEPVWTAPITTEPPTPSIRLDALVTSQTGATIPKCHFPDYGRPCLTDKLFGVADELESSGGFRQASPPRKGLVAHEGISLYPRKPFARFPLEISDKIVSAAKRHSFVGYVQAPPGFVRNSESGHEKPPVVKGMHGSLAEKSSPRRRSVGKTADSQNVISGRDLDLSKPFAKSFYVEMDLVAWESIEGFNFLKYNKSALFCGLENALPNVYVNAAVQVLYFTPPIRKAIGVHVCDREWCISCELGFLFHMFDLGGAGMACEAGNFTRAFMTMANAGALGLFDGPHALPLSQRIENFTRYLLEQLHKDEEAEGDGSVVSALFGADMISSGVFTPSRTDWERNSRPFQHTLLYDNEDNCERKSFCELLQHSLSRSFDPTRAFCESSGQFETMSQRRELKSLPNVLLIGCDSKAGAYKRYWHRGAGPLDETEKYGGHHFSPELKSAKLQLLEREALAAMSQEKALVQSIRLDLSEGVSVSEIGQNGEGAVDNVSGRVRFGYDNIEDRNGSEDTGERFADYDLSFVIAHVPPLDQKVSPGPGGNGSRNIGGHLVAYIHVPEEYRDEGKAEKRAREGLADMRTEWWCFNDFVISPCEGFDEVAAFNESWKMPCLLGYVRRDLGQRVEVAEADKDLRVRDIIGGGEQNGAVGLQDDEEEPGKGSVFGLDCEFVMVGRDEADIFGDGTRQVIVPARLALARVSVVRGCGRLKGTALLDDYVRVREPVVDYLTRFSGLEEGDLDEGRSRHVVSSLKTVYKRLRCLVDAGCIFVGHGLKSDFRIINFVVPPEQVVDTVTLFRAGSKRLLGLRFLSNALLGGDIQSVTHDSIEDATAALSLYEVYLRLRGRDGRRDVFEKNLKNLYSFGYSTGWKVDSDERFILDWESDDEVSEELG